ncbi:MAG: ATP-binding protein [Dehalococcoidia bacterium]|nr:ATP-binding protein [Dehalococcoidia bacterium]
MPINLDDLLDARSVEQVGLEFKATWNPQIAESAVRTISAFANDILNLNGGYLIIGIEEDEQGNPILPPRGLADLNLDETQRQIRGACNRIAPDYQPFVVPQDYLGRRILVIWAPAGDNRPYEAPRRGSDDRAHFVRFEPETIEAMGDRRRQLIAQTARVPFDDRRSLTGELGNIVFFSVQKFLGDIRSELARDAGITEPLEVYRRLRLTVPINSHDVPRNVALLFLRPIPTGFSRCQGGDRSVCGRCGRESAGGANDSGTPSRSNQADA